MMRRTLSAVMAAVFAATCLTACTQEMKNQHKLKPLRPSTFFADGRASRPLVEDTMARGMLRTDEQLYKGTIDGVAADSFPFPVTRQVLERGRERYQIYCSICHGLSGYGDGMVVKRGFKTPPSYHIDRLRAVPDGYIYGVITNGFGVMSDYAAQIPPEDRWAIVAYVRALQLSQNAHIQDVPADKRSLLSEKK